jgi:photosystem II stability/assembly factor-like uncharacterized protein
VTPDEQELRRALDGRSGAPSPEFRARMAALSYEERPMAGGLSVVALVVAATLTIASIGVLFFARQAMTPQHGGPASTARLASPTPLPSPTPTQLFLPQTAQLSAPSADILWVYFAQGLLFRSTDRGDTWVQRSLPTQSLSSSANVTFVDDQHGWLFAGGSQETQCNGDGTVIWQTADGAASWTQVASIDGTAPGSSGIAYAQCKESLSFVDLTNGFLTAWDDNHAPTIYRTADGGHTWKGAPLPDPPGFVTQPGGFSLRDGSVRAFGTTLLVSAYGMNAATQQPQEYVARSTDGGASWTYVVTTSHQLRGVTFVTASRWLELQGYTGSYETTDAGKTWHAFPNDYQDAAGVVSFFVFADDQVGYGTVRGAIHRTIDGGSHWTYLKTPGT